MKPKNKKIKVISIGILSIVMFLFVANFARAALVQCGGAGQPVCTVSGLVDTTINIINYLLAWSWLVAVLFIMWAGWGFLNAAGNQEKITEAKATFTSAIIGFFLIIAAYVLLNAIVWVLLGGSTDPANKLPIKTIFDFLK